MPRPSFKKVASRTNGAKANKKIKAKAPRPPKPAEEKHVDYWGRPKKHCTDCGRWIGQGNWTQHAKACQ